MSPENTFGNATGRFTVATDGTGMMDSQKQTMNGERYVSGLLATD